MSDLPLLYIFQEEIESIALLQSISTFHIPQLYGALCDADPAMDMVFYSGLTEFGMLSGVKVGLN